VSCNCETSEGCVFTCGEDAEAGLSAYRYVIEKKYIDYNIKSVMIIYNLFESKYRYL
jgi:hypothetical protein